jgi:hypothetical protein
VYWSEIKQKDISKLSNINNEGKLYVVPTNYIVGSQIVVPYGLDNPKGPEKLSVEPMNKWMNALINEMEFRSRKKQAALTLYECTHKQSSIFYIVLSTRLDANRILEWLFPFVPWIPLCFP